jgi:hypothetical protein
MIGKVVPPGKGFSGLVRYLLDGGKDNPSPIERATWHAIRNMLIDDPRLVPALMRATAEKSKRVQVPVYHYVISWARQEAPSDDFMRQVADVTCGDLELDEYQRLYVAHDDTDHRHVHIVVNRVHPETGVAWRTSNDYARIETSLRRQAEVAGMAFVPGRHNTADQSPGKPRRPKTRELQRAKRLQQRTPQPQWSRQEADERKATLRLIFDQARSWDHLARALAAENLHLQRKGQGLVISAPHGDLKLSQLGKSYRLQDLEMRFSDRLADYEQRSTKPPERPKTDEVAGATKAPQAVARHGTAAAPTSRTRPDGHLRPHQTPPKSISRDAMATELRAVEQRHWEAFHKARDAFDFAYIFHEIGLIDDRQLDSSRRDLKAAEALVEQTKPLMEQLLKNLFGEAKPDERPRQPQRIDHQPGIKDEVAKAMADIPLHQTAAHPKSKSKRRTRGR